MSHPADAWRDELRSRLLTARKQRDAVSVSALRAEAAIIVDLLAAR